MKNKWPKDVESLLRPWLHINWADKIDILPPLYDGPLSSDPMVVYIEGEKTTPIMSLNYAIFVNNTREILNELTSKINTWIEKKEGIISDNKNLIRIDIRHPIYCFESERDNVERSYWKEYMKWRKQWDLSRLSPADRELMENDPFSDIIYKSPYPDPEEKP